MNRDDPRADHTTGGSSDLDSFLAALRQHLPPRETPTPLPGEPLDALREIDASQDTVAQFVTAATAAGCRVYRTTDDGWVTQVLDLLRSRTVGRIIVEPHDQTALTRPRGQHLLEALELEGIQATGDRDAAALFDAGAAVTGVTAAIAETGTIVCTSGPDTARGSSLIPAVHIAVVAGGQIVPDLFDYFAALPAGADLPANINLISGPSKTADIEGILITGVHGPGEVHIVVIE